MAMGTALIDTGFVPISVENVPQLGPVFGALATLPHHHAASADGEKLFLTTTNGLFMFDRKGKVLGHWPNILSTQNDCESCISANEDGSRVAVITRNAGMWEAQVYDIRADQASLSLSLPSEKSYQGIPNEASIAISPDDRYLAFKAGPTALRVFDLQTKQTVLEYNRAVNGITFTPDGVSFVIHGGQEMLFYNASTWKQRANLLMPRDDTPYAFSQDGKFFAIALATKMRIFTVDNLQMLREINVPPSNADTRQWQISFANSNTLNGYAIRWDGSHTSATVETGQWNIDSGEQIRLDTTTTSAPNAIEYLWGAPLSLPASPGELEGGTQIYNAFRFVSDGLLLLNSPHSACWLKLPTGETTCFTDAKQVLFAQDGTVLTEVIEPSSTSLKDRSGKTVIQVGPYRIAAITRNGDWALVDTGTSADLYTAGKKLPQESAKGNPQGFAENGNTIVFTALEKENSYTINIVEKKTGNTIYQKKDNFLYKPILMTADGSIYYMQNELDHNRTVLNVIDPKTQKTSEIIRLALPAEPITLALSNTGLFAIGQKDGSVLVMSKDGEQSASFQAANSAIDGLSFSLDGRYIAVASAEGVHIYAVMP
jgi:WD40 repeat protein